MFSRRELIWGYAAQALNIGFGLLILPMILHTLPQAEVGLWFVFLTIAGLAQLLDMGLQPTLARNISYIYAGVQGLFATGLCESEVKAEMNVALLSDVFAASRLICRYIALTSAFVLLVPGTAYISTLLTKDVDRGYILVAWVCFASGNILSFYYGYLNAFLQGRGDITQANQVVVVSRAVQFVLGVLLLVGGLGLTGLGLATLASAVCSRLMAYRFFRSGSSVNPVPNASTKSGQKYVMRIIWHQASRYGLVLIGVFLIWRANILVASSTLGLAEAASYGLAIQIFILLQSIASVPFNLALPKLSRMRAHGDTESATRLFGVLLVTTLFLYMVLAAAAFGAGNPILSALGSQVRLPPNLIFAAMIIVFFLELNHGTCANYILTSNQIPFVLAALVTGIAIVASSVLLAPVIGIAGFVVCQAVFQLAYNNWKWPTEVSKMSGLAFRHMILDGIRSFKRI